jgi:hypothetical protein
MSAAPADRIPAEDGTADAQVGCDGSAKIARQQDRAEHGGARERIERRTDKAQYAEIACESLGGGITELTRRFYHDVEGHELDETSGLALSVLPKQAPADATKVSGKPCTLNGK